jgi:hypothetical protein
MKFRTSAWPEGVDAANRALYKTAIGGGRQSRRRYSLRDAVM